MKLYICEKPSQAKDLAKVLSLNNMGFGSIGNKSIKVTWAIGHLIQQLEPNEIDAKYSKWNINDLPIIPSEWKFKPNSKTKKQLEIVGKLLKRTNHVVIATDGDREGETIGRELLDFFNWRGRIERLWLTALDEKSIQKSLANLKKGEDTKPLYYAGLARSRADWIVGMNCTRALTIVANKKGHRGVLSVGRVQSPTLAIVVNRDLEIENFKSKNYYDIKGIFSNITTRWCPDETKEAQHLDSDNRCINKSYADTVAENVKNSTAIVDEYITQRKRTLPPLLFSLSVLQQEASKRYGFGAKQVLDIAQSLYEKHKITTYPRSDCQYLPESQWTEASEILNSIAKIDSNLLQLTKNADTSIKSRVFNTNKVTAHHGIIPTSKIIDIRTLNENELKLYDLIRRNYIAQFYPNYEYDQTQIKVKASTEIFSATFNAEVVVGWKQVIKTFGNKANNQIPKLTKGQQLNVDSIVVETKQTKPPLRYTEGTLISAMEKAHLFVTDTKLKAVLKGNEGIGTEATRANIIETLLSRDFLTKNKKQIISTNIGRSLIASIPNELKDPGMTALWENSLSKIELNELSLEDFMQSQTVWLNQLLNKLKESTSNIVVDKGKTYPCPNCGKDMIIRNGAKGKFWACTGYPDCKTTAQNSNGKAVFESDLPKCPKCNKPMKRRSYKKDKKTLYFWACTGYFDTPKCEQTLQDKRGKPVFS